MLVVEQSTLVLVVVKVLLLIENLRVLAKLVLLRDLVLHTQLVVEDHKVEQLMLQQTQVMVVGGQEMVLLASLLFVTQFKEI
jgi:hypothetical protein